MVDILDEARDEWKQQQLIAMLKEYGKYLVLLGVVLIASIVGWQWWQGRAERAARAASVDYFAALRAVQSGNSEEGAAKLKAVAEGGSGYAQLASLMQAGLLNGDGKSEEALKAYDEIADSGSADRAVRDLAALHAAQLRLDSGNPEEKKAALKALDELSESGHPWRYSAIEVKAFSQLEAKDYAAAKESFTLITTAPEAPSSLREHAADMLLHIGYLEGK